MLNGVCRTPEEVPPKGAVDELKKWKDTIGADGGTRGFAVKKEWEEPETERVALLVQSSFKILYPCDAFLSIAYHFAEEVCERCSAKLRGACTVEIPVIDGFSI